MIAQHPITVPLDARGRRLDAYLADMAGVPHGAAPWQGFSRARFQRLISDGHVTVDGAQGRAAQRLRGGECVAIAVPAPEPMALTPVPMALDVLHEDADIILVNKPAGLVVHPGAGTRAPTLVHGLLAHCGDLSGIGGVARPGIVHRLDGGTSGVIVVAKHDRAHEGLARQFAQRTTVKRYVALVLGEPKPAQATLCTLFGRHPVHRQRYTSRVPRGKTAITSYSVQAAAGGLALLDILLGTGRTHQIRVHMAEAGHPVVGDPVYGGRAWSRITHAAWRAQGETLTHQALHAASLAITHPITGKPLRIEAPLPRAWKALAQALCQSS